jgi:hypothetical protein
MNEPVSGVMKNAQKIPFEIHGGFVQQHSGKILFGIALLARLVAFPFADIVEADAGARLFLADHAMHFSGELSSYQWPALHIYALGFFQWISGDRVLGPAVFDLLLGAGAVVPFYFFTKNIFNKEGAFYTSLIFTFCPLVFRAGFLPLSEIFNLFFCVTALWCLSEALVRPDKKIKWILLAGFSITIACGARFEAWILAVLLGGILLALRQWKMFFLFGMATSVFPVTWLLVCYLKTGDALISVHMVQHQNFDIGKINSALGSKKEILKRIIFFPFSWLVALTPVIAFIILKMQWRVGIHPRKFYLRFLFMLVFVFWMLFFIYETITGDRVTQHRFTLILIFLSLPFYAMWFERRERMRLKKLVSLLTVALIIPWSFTWQWIPWQKAGLGFTAPSSAIAEIVPGTFQEMQAVPLIRPRSFVSLGKEIKSRSLKDQGLFIDYCGWNPTSFLALQSSLPADNIFQEYDYEPHHGDNGLMEKFFRKFPRGLLVLSDFSSLQRETRVSGNLIEFDSVPGALLLEPLINNAHYRLFEYSFLSPQEAGIQKQKYTLAVPLYNIRKDRDYYAALNYMDGSWLADTWRDALKGHRSLEEQVYRNADWMVRQDALKEKTKK